LAQIFFFSSSKNKIIFNFDIFVATKKVAGGTTNLFSPPLLFPFLDPGCDIRDPRSGMDKNQDPGSGINIPDPQH
jgi:hypothetical protein